MPPLRAGFVSVPAEALSRVTTRKQHAFDEFQTCPPNVPTSGGSARARNVKAADPKPGRDNYCVELGSRH